MNWSEEELPEGWKLRTMRDVARVVGGGTPKTSIPGNFSNTEGHPWITPADLTGYTEKFIARGRRYLTDQGLSTSAARYIPAGSVLFSSRAPIGYVAIASSPVTTNQGFRSFVPNGEVEPEYLYYVLKLLKPAAEQMASGTTFPEISGSKAAQLPIAYPPKDEQRRIVAVLDRFTTKERSASAHLSAARRAVDRFRRSVLAAACSGGLTADWREANPNAESVDRALTEFAGKRPRRRAVRGERQVELELPELPESYRVASVADAAVLIEYGTSQRAEAGKNGGVPILRMGNIQDGRLDLRDLKYRQMDAELERLLLRDGDLLFNRTNSPELVGKSAVFHGEEPTSFASYLIRVRFAPDVADPDFVNYWINSAWGRAWAQQAKTDGVSQSNINGTKLGLMPIPLPPLEEQREIVRRTSRMLEFSDSLLERLKSAQRLVDRSSQAILAKAFRGGLTA